MSFVVPILASALAHVAQPQSVEIVPAPGSLIKDGGVTIKDIDSLTENSKAGKTRYSGNGSGFFISNDGYLVTNHHVVDGAAEVIAVWQDKAYMMDVVAVNKKMDLALLRPTMRPKSKDGTYVYNRVKPPQFPFIGFDDGVEFGVGDTVYVIGYPKIYLQGLEVKVTKGIVSSLSGFKGRQDNFQMDAAIQGGNSGGPVVNETGRLVGVSVASLIGGENVNYAIKLSEVKKFIAGRVKLSVLPQMPRNRGAMLKKVVSATALILNYEDGSKPIPYDTETKDEKAANEAYAKNQKAILYARLLKVRREWKELKGVTDSLLDRIGPVEDLKEMNDLARDELGLHLVLIAEADNADVNAKITPVHGIKEEFAVCGKPFAVYCEGKTRGFPVKAVLEYEDDGKHWKGVADLIYDWHGTKEVRIKMKRQR